MDSKILLIRVLTLLYKESTLPNNISEDTKQLATQLIQGIKTTGLSMSDLDSSSRTIETLKDEIIKILGSIEPSINLPLLKQTLRAAIVDDNELYQSFVEIADLQDVKENASIVRNLKSELKTFLNKNEIVKVMKEGLHKIYSNDVDTNLRDLTANIVERMNQYTVRYNADDQQHPALVCSLNFGDLSQMQDVMEDGLMKLDTENTLRTGLQGINEMLGAPGGFRRGEFCVYSALQYNFKSGFALLLFIHILMYNTPKLRDPKKKPLILFYSFENIVASNILIIYQYLKENELGHVVDIKDGTFDPKNPDYKENIKAASAYVISKLTETGFDVRMEGYNSSVMTTADLLDAIGKYEEDGYEVIACIADYLAVLNRTGLSQGAHGDDLRDMFRRVRNFTGPRYITFITPHQMSADATNLYRDANESLVQAVVGKGYYDGCKRLGQEPDLELHIHIERTATDSYLTIARGKHRDVNSTDPSKLYCVYKFQPYGTIPPDIFGASQARKKVGGVSDAGDNAWYESNI